MVIKLVTYIYELYVVVSIFYTDLTSNVVKHLCFYNFRSIWIYDYILN